MGGLAYVAAGCQLGVLERWREVGKIPRPSIEGATAVGSQICAACHPNQIETFKQTVHARLAGFERGGALEGCEACHGPGSLHVKGGGDRTKIITFTKLSASEKESRSEVCLTCHRGRPHLAWRGSVHPLNGVACTDCHTLMKPAPKLLARAEPEVCLQCHRERQAELNFPSRHPIREGKIRCSDCHNPHGSETKKLVKAATVNQLCVSCHAEKEGPFLFEHPPVTESCTLCHSPHGTTANNLLVQNVPFLCLQCHPSHVRCA